jgi:hypothetical protein
MMFAEAKRVDPDLVRMRDLLNQLPETRGWIDRTAVFVERGRETVNTYLHR